MGQGEAALGYVERAKARALVDMLAAKTDFAVEGGSADQVRALLARADAAETQSFALDDRLKTQTRSITMEVRLRRGRSIDIRVVNDAPRAPIPHFKAAVA